MKPDVTQAIQEIRAACDGHVVDVIAEAQGGAHVIVRDVPIGSGFVPSQTWIGFTIPFQYPDADVYPHFIGGEVQRADGGPLGEALSGPTTWQDRSAIAECDCRRYLDTDWPGRTEPCHSARTADLPSLPLPACAPQACRSSV